MDLDLKGKRAIVTGGTRGIGRAVAETLAREGCAVGVCARNKDQVEATVAALRDLGVEATGGAVDVGDGDALRGWVGEAAEALGGLDVFVANVSALARGYDMEDWQQSFEIDLLGTIHGVEAALPALEKSDAGAVVVIGTTAALEISRGARPYGAMKAALINYTKGLARSHAAKGIRVNAVSPGNVYFKGGVWDMVETNDPEFFAASLAENPMGRMGTPQEVANATVFLASPAAGFISGTDLVIDGAMTRRVQF
jgi:3-oxoacyl-[acyl-carrier protein] reductase